MQREMLLAKAAALQELSKRKQLPINQYQPDDYDGRRQLDFHKSNKTFRLVLGGNRSGKSVSTAAEAAYWALGCHPYLERANKRPNKIWVISNEYRTIYEGIWRHLRPDAKDQPLPGMGFLPPSKTKLGPKIMGHEIPSHIEVKHGQPAIDENGQRYYRTSRIDFISCDKKESGRRKTQAAAVDLIIVDEEIDDSVFGELKARIMESDGSICISATLVRSEEWLLELEDKFKANDPDVFLTRLDTSKNEHISEEGRRKIIGSYTNEEKQIRVLGHSTRESGLVYKEFTNIHSVDPFKIPDNFEIYFILDPGFRTFAGLWAAFDREKKLVYLVDELYLFNTNLHEVAKTLIANPLYQYSNKLGLIDPAAIRKLETGEPGVASQLLTHYNILTIPAFNAVEAGINAVHDLFKIDEVIGVPRLRVFNTLNYFFKEIRQYRIKKDTSSFGSHEQKDEPLRKRNHLMDCMKYLCLYLHPRYIEVKQRKTSGYQQVNANRFSHPILGSEW